METKTLTIEWSGPSNKNPKYGRIKDSTGTWYDCPVGMVPQIPKGATLSLIVEQNEKGYWQIKGVNRTGAAPIAQMAPIVQAAPQSSPQRPGISKEAGMAAMAVIGKLFQGTQTLPSRAVLAQMFADVAMAWTDAENMVMDQLSSPNEPF